MFPLADALNVPEPLIGVAAPNVSDAFVSCTKLPVKVRVPLIVTPPVLLFVSVLVDDGVTVPPNVIAPAPRIDAVLVNAAPPAPKLTVPGLVSTVRLPAKESAGLVTVVKVTAPPVLTVKSPVNVLSAAPVKLAILPVLSIWVVPEIVIMFPLKVVVPLATSKLPGQVIADEIAAVPDVFRRVVELILAKLD